MDYDFVIVGSGFGGSVSALRLAEKGYKVAVVEQGQWVTPADMEQAADDIKKLNWLITISGSIVISVILLHRFLPPRFHCRGCGCRRREPCLRSGVIEAKGRILYRPRLEQARC